MLEWRCSSINIKSQSKPRVRTSSSQALQEGKESKQHELMVYSHSTLIFLNFLLWPGQHKILTAKVIKDKQIRSDSVTHWALTVHFSLVVKSSLSRLSSSRFLSRMRLADRRPPKSSSLPESKDFTRTQYRVSKKSLSVQWKIRNISNLTPFVSAVVTLNYSQIK